MFMRPTQYVVRARLPSGRRFVGYTYSGLLPAVGMNDAGIAQSCDSLWPDDFRIGVPRMFVARAILEAGSIEEAATIAQMPGRAGGYAHVFADSGGRTAWMETTATRGHLEWGDRWSAHTNHYLHPALALRQNQANPASEHRLETLNRLVAGGRPGLPLVKRVLAEHGHHGRRVCRHRSRRSGRRPPFGTIGSVIMNLGRGEALISTNYPCQDEFRRIPL